MKKFGIGLIVVLFLFVWEFTAIYHHIASETKTKAQKAISEAKKDFQIKSIVSANEYRGNFAYEVVQAKLTNGSDLWIWLPENKKVVNVPVTARASDGYTKNEIKKAFKQNVPYQKILSVKCGLLNQKNPAWAITYVDQNGDYVFSYYDFYTGKSVRPPIALKRS